MESNNFLGKIFKKTSLQSCKYLCSSIVFDYKNNIKLCPYSNEFIIKENYDGIWLDIDYLNKKKQEYIDQNQKEISSVCVYCHLKKIKLLKRKNPVETLILSNWKYCYLNCSYCDSPKEEDLIKAKHYDLYNTIVQLFDSNIIDTKTKIIFESGDATIHPEFDKLMYYFINMGFQHIVVNSPAMRYCESIAEAIGKNICNLIVSFDSGCPYIYERVKGVNKFDIAISNIKRYLGFQLPSEKRVALKYTLVNGVNDNQKELLDWFMLARDLGVKKLAFDIEDKWFNQLKHSVPQYLKELLVFVKNMSVYNNIEIEYSDKIDSVYNSIK